MTATRRLRVLRILGILALSATLWTATAAPACAEEPRAGRDESLAAEPAPADPGEPVSGTPWLEDGEPVSGRPWLGDGEPVSGTPWLESGPTPGGAGSADDDGSWLDGFNRGSRELNFWIFDHVLEPVSRGYNFVMPKWGQQRIQNFFENLERPRDIVNSLLQGKGRRAGNHLAAFLVNTTAGLAGLFVLSDRFITIEPPETTNETLGVYGIPTGPYLVLPLYGESCPRCLLGSVGDAVLYPLFWIPGQAGLYAGIGAGGLNAVNLVAKQMPAPFASDSEWAAYRQRLHDRHSYEEAKRLFFENQELDVAD